MDSTPTLSSSPFSPELTLALRAAVARQSWDDEGVRGAIAAIVADAKQRGTSPRAVVRRVARQIEAEVVEMAARRELLERALRWSLEAYYGGVS